MDPKIKIFEKEIDLITDINLKKFTQACVHDCPDYFFIMPASTTGKYHPNYSLGVGGLVRHTKAAVKLANDILSLEQNKELCEHRNEVIVALILHDSVKKGMDGSCFTVTQHPLHAVSLVKKVFSITQTGVKKEQVDLICDLIASHMGQWNKDYKSDKEVLPKPETELQKFVHLCDYLASRKYLTVDL